MSRHSHAWTGTAVVLACAAVLASPAAAQQPAAAPQEPATPTYIIERDETRIVLVDMLANSTRSMHSHDDMLWHVFVTMHSPIVLTIQGQEQQVRLGPWESYFFKGGTVHAITNPSPAPVQFMEFFAKRMNAAAARETAEALALALGRASGTTP